MATDHLQIPDITASQNQKEVTANAAHNLLDRAMNQLVQKTVVSGSNTLSTTQARENAVIEVIGTPGAAWQLDLPDTNERVLMIINNTDGQGTIRNSASGGSGQPVLEIGESTLFHYDGTDFIEVVGADAGSGSSVATVQTTDATVTNLDTVAVASGETVSIHGFGTGQGPSNASIGFHFIGTAHNNGGTTTLDGRVVDILDDNANGWTVDIDADDTGDTIRIRVTGAGGTTIDWRVQYEIVTET